MSNNIHELTGLYRDKTAAAVEEGMRGLAVLVEHRAEIAAHRHMMYLAYIDAGFTAGQALELCKVLV